MEETLWLLKQWIIPEMGAGDLDALAAASPILSSATRKERMEMRKKRVALYVPRLRFGNHTTLYARNLSMLAAALVMKGLIFSA